MAGAFQAFSSGLAIIMQILLLLQKTLVMNCFVTEQGYWAVFLNRCVPESILC